MSSHPLNQRPSAVQLASGDPDGFLDGLRAAGVVVRERRDRDGALTGYAVGRPVGPGEREVLFGGGKLAPDLSLPRLQAKWRASGPVQPVVAESALPARGSQAELAAALRARSEPARRLATVGVACEQAAALLADAAARRGAGVGEEDALTADVVAASADVFRAVGLLLEAPSRGPLRAAARDVDRASRTPGGSHAAADTDEPEPAAQRPRSGSR